MRCFVSAIVILFLTWGATAAPPEVRGTWLTTTGPDHIASGQNTEQITGQLRTVGVNTVYVEAWKNGYTNYPSSIMQSLIGVDRAPLLGSARDLMHETSIVAHRENMIHMAWFEYGFSSQFVGNGGTPNNPLSQYLLSQTSVVNGQSVQGWLLQDQSGNYGNSSNGFAWMNPAVPEVRQLLVDLAVESIQNYDVDGIQFDDRLAWPREFGWDATTAAYYLAETGRALPSNVNDANFRIWRQSKVSQFASELYTALKAADPDIFVSVSPSITGFSDNQFNAVWTDWVDNGLFDEYVPQVYRDNLASYRAVLPSNIAPFTANNRLEDLVVGIRFNGTGADTPLPDVQQMIVDAALAEGGALAGHSLFYSKGLIDNATAMEAFYGDAVLGPAPHPTFGPDHRPDALVALQDGSNTSLWNVDVTETGVYRIVARVGGRWTQAKLSFLEPGNYDLVIPNATAVELLVSRRLEAIVDGDFNLDGTYNCRDVDALSAEIVAGTDRQQFDMTGDGQVDHHDLSAWLTAAGAVVLPSGNAFLPADANLDGDVDAQDFLIWNDNKFTNQSAFCDGDLDANGVVDGQDFLIWNDHKFSSSASAVPEPSAGLLWLGMCACLWAQRGCDFLKPGTTSEPQGASRGFWS